MQLQSSRFSHWGSVFAAWKHALQKRIKKLWRHHWPRHTGNDLLSCQKTNRKPGRSISAHEGHLPAFRSRKYRQRNSTQPRLKTRPNSTAITLVATFKDALPFLKWIGSRQPKALWGGGGVQAEVKTDLQTSRSRSSTGCHKEVHYKQEMDSWTSEHHRLHQAMNKP